MAIPGSEELQEPPVSPSLLTVVVPPSHKELSKAVIIQESGLALTVISKELETSGQGAVPVMI